MHRVRYKSHKQKEQVKSSLQQIYGSGASALLNKSGFNLISTDYQGEEVMVASIYIESMDWFLVGTVPVHEVFAELML